MLLTLFSHDALHKGNVWADRSRKNWNKFWMVVKQLCKYPRRQKNTNSMNILLKVNEHCIVTAANISFTQYEHCMLTPDGIYCIHLVCSMELGHCCFWPIVPICLCSFSAFYIHHHDFSDFSSFRNSGSDDCKSQIQRHKWLILSWILIKQYVSGNLK